MNKGIVMELNESSIIVMRADGKFERLPQGNRTCQVGEEIVYADARPRLKVPSLAIASGLIAAVVLCFVIFIGLTGTTASGQVVAYVTIDINPSIELGIDVYEIVVDVRGLNTDGSALIASLNYKGKTLETVTEEIFDIAEKTVLANGEADIIITSTIVQENDKVNDETVADKLKQQTINHIQEEHPDQVSSYEVTSFATPQEVRNQAQENGISAGKYAIYLNAVNNGVSVTLEEIKEVSIHQIAKDNGGIQNLIIPDQPVSKSNLKKLVEEEKSGKLKERQQQLEKDNKNKKDDMDDKKNEDKDSKDDKENNNERDNKNDNRSNNSNNNSSSNTDNRDNTNDKKNSNSNSNNNNNSSRPTGTTKPVSSPSVKQSPFPDLLPSLRPSPSPSDKKDKDDDKDDKNDRDARDDNDRDARDDNDRDDRDYNDRDDRDDNDRDDRDDNDRDDSDNNDRNDLIPSSTPKPSDGGDSRSDHENKNDSKKDDETKDKKDNIKEGIDKEVKEKVDGIKDKIDSIKEKIDLDEKNKKDRQNGQKKSGNN